ncbi:MAG: hypothetical protein DMF62_11025, partial [Acidobacteria bacterium]
MIKHYILILSLCLTAFVCIDAQMPVNVGIQILKAEDARRYDDVLEKLMRSPNASIRNRAVLAAGRVGDERAIDWLLKTLQQGPGDETRRMAAFALGEIESAKAADGILSSLIVSGAVVSAATSGGNSQERNNAEAIVARVIEAAGKIAAANPNDPKSKELSAAILKALAYQASQRTTPNSDVILLGLTAVLRSRPAGADEIVRKYLAFTDPNIVATALNTLARLRAKNANRDARDLLATHLSAVVRANAARVLASAEDKEAVDVLIKAATTDSDSRVRVSAIRALGALKDAKAANPLLMRGEALFDAYKKAWKPNYIPAEQNEFIEIATSLGRIIPNSYNQRAEDLFRAFGKIDKGHATEVYTARVRIGQRRGDPNAKPELTDWHQYSTLAQIAGEFASIEPVSEVGKQMKAEAPGVFRPLAVAFASADPAIEGKNMLAGPDVLQAYARFKTDDLGELMRTALQNKDVQMRAAAAGILADLPPSKENIAALKAAFEYGRLNDTNSNDALLASLDALIKLDPTGSDWPTVMGHAIISPDHLVRQKVKGVLPPETIKITSHQLLYEVTPYFGKGTKIGQVLNTDVDYRRALSRKNGLVKAILTTEKGTFTIDLLPEDAPLTVDNFVKLARAKYFDGLEVHRVVPNFVMQDGDPRGDGNGGPGWTIRCEVNMVPYERGTVGMALSGKDTGGSQWFVTHSPQPHL